MRISKLAKSAIQGKTSVRIDVYLILDENPTQLPNYAWNLIYRTRPNHQGKHVED